MRMKVLRRVLAALLLSAALAGAVVSIGLWRAEQRALRRIALPPLHAVLVPTDNVALERGRYLYESRGCAECHGADGGGRTFARDGDNLELAGPNITKVAGGVVGFYQPVDWVRTIRHGVKPDEQPLRVMPSEDYNRMTDADLGALVAYVQSLPPKPGRAAVIKVPLPVRVLYGFGAIPDAVERIDHSLPPEVPVPEAVSVEHGRYVAQMCTGCHGEKFEGGPIVGGPPDWPPAARLAPGEGNVMATRYAAAEAFLKMLRTGQAPDGRKIAVMPFESLAKLSDTDARALHLYLRSLVK